MQTGLRQGQLGHAALALRYALVCATRASEAVEDGDLTFAIDILAELEVEIAGVLESVEETA